MKTKIAAFVLLAFTTALAHAQGDEPRHDARVERLLDRAEWRYDIDSDGDFRIGYEFDDGRSHLAWINSGTQTLGDLEIREVWAVGYHSDDDISADLAKTLLQQNHEYKLGAWKIQRFNRREAAVFYVQIAADADEQTLIGALISVLSSADKLEEALTGEDDL